MSKLHNPLEESVMTYIAGGFNAQHNGVDIGGPAFYESPVFATETGTLHNVQYFGSYPQYNGVGNFLYLTSAKGRVWEYGHVIAFDLPDGTVVATGQQIGRMGNTGWVVPNPQVTGNPKDGTHLHFGLEVNGTRVDPLAYIQEHGSEAPVSGGAMVEYIYTVTPDDYMGLESIVIKLYGDLTHYYDVLEWNPVLKTNPDHIEVGQQIKYYKPAPSAQVPAPVAEVQTGVEEMESRLGEARKTISEQQAVIKNLEREYTTKLITEVQSREDVIVRLQQDATTSNIVKAVQIDRLKTEITKLKGIDSVFSGAVKLNAQDLVKDILEESGVLTKLIKKWESWIDWLAAKNIPIISTVLQTKSVQSLLKYDLFVFVGAMLLTWVASVTGALNMPPDIVAMITVGALGIKQYLTLGYDANKDGKLDIQDTQMLKQYLPEKPVE